MPVIFTASQIRQALPGHQGKITQSGKLIRFNRQILKRLTFVKTNLSIRNIQTYNHFANLVYFFFTMKHTKLALSLSK
jgi:hypothetical protein